MWIEEVNEALDWSLPTKKDYETVAGLILSSLGRIPRPGEQVTVGGYELAVVDADERRILKVKIRGRERATDAAPAPPPPSPAPPPAPTAAPTPTQGGHSA
jgi:putative hemolysin